MVLLSAAIKGVPTETLEAARIDGASERQIFFRVVVPQIRGTMITVFITVLIGVMKIFDIVYVMTNGNFNTNVIAIELLQPAVHQRQRRLRGGDRRHAADRDDPGPGLPGPPLPGRGGDAMTSTATVHATAAQAADDGAETAVAMQPEGSPARRLGRRIVLGHLPALDRPDDRPAHHVVPDPGRRRRHRLVDASSPPGGLGPDARELHRGASRQADMGNAFVNSLVDHAAGDVHPDPDRGVRGLRVHVHGVPGPRLPVHPRSSACWWCRSRSRSSPLLKIYGRRSGINGTFPAVWLAHIGFGMPLAIYILRNYMATLPEGGHRVGQDRRGQPLPDVLAADPADVGARAGVVRDLPVPVGVERPAGRAGLHRPGRERSR